MRVRVRVRKSGRPCSEKLQENNPKAEDISGCCQLEGWAVGWVQIPWSPLDLAADVWLVPCGPTLHQSKITHLGFETFTYQDVTWLYVSVDYAWPYLFMQMCNSCAPKLKTKQIPIFRFPTFGYYVYIRCVTFICLTFCWYVISTKLSTFLFLYYCCYEATTQHTDLIHEFLTHYNLIPHALVIVINHISCTYLHTFCCSNGYSSSLAPS